MFTVCKVVVFLKGLLHYLVKIMALSSAFGNFKTKKGYKGHQVRMVGGLTISGGTFLPLPLPELGFQVTLATL